MIEYKMRPQSWIVGPVGEHQFHAAVITVSIADELGGEFVELTCCSDSHAGKIAVDPEQWPALRAAINKAVRMCRTEEQIKAEKTNARS